MEIKNNPIIYNTIRVWREMRKRLGREDCTSFLTPLLRNKDFVPGMSRSMFDTWHKNGLRVIGDLFQNNTLMNFEQLQ